MSEVTADGSFGKIFIPQPLIDHYRSIGRQAVIFTTCPDNIEFSLLNKVFCINASDNRPTTPDWIQSGGREGAEALVQQMTAYRQRLKSVGFPVPQGEVFTISLRAEDGLYYPAQICYEQGKINAEIEMKRAGNDLEMTLLTNEILDLSLPLFLTDGLGADLKPANWVRITRSDSVRLGRLVHVDPLPVLMYDSAKKTVVTEWPEIEDLSLQDFLYQTHLSILSLGYRLYQECCQVLPAKRSLFLKTIQEKIDQWERTSKINSKLADLVKNSLVPQTSQLLGDFLQGKRNKITLEEINRQIEGLENKNWPPIYHLREMAFLIAEQELRRHDNHKAVDEFLNHVRKLTSLRTPKNQRGDNNRAAMKLIVARTEKLLSE